MWCSSSNSGHCVRIFVRIDLIFAVLSILSASVYYFGFHLKPSDIKGYNMLSDLLGTVLVLSMEIFLYRLATKAIEQNNFSNFFGWFCCRLLCLGIFLGMLAGYYPPNNGILTIIIVLIVYRLLSLLAGKEFLQNLAFGKVLLSSENM